MMLIQKHWTGETWWMGNERNGNFCVGIFTPFFIHTWTTTSTLKSWGGNMFDPHKLLVLHCESSLLNGPTHSASLRTFDKIPKEQEQQKLSLFLPTLNLLFSLSNSLPWKKFRNSTGTDEHRKTHWDQCALLSNVLWPLAKLTTASFAFSAQDLLIRKTHPHLHNMNVLPFSCQLSPFSAHAKPDIFWVAPGNAHQHLCLKSSLITICLLSLLKATIKPFVHHTFAMVVSYISHLWEPPVHPPSTIWRQQKVICAILTGPTKANKNGLHGVPRKGRMIHIS